MYDVRKSRVYNDVRETSKVSLTLKSIDYQDIAKRLTINQ
jgi:hypothetical protein